MKVVIEFFQGALLNIASLMTPSGDLWEAGRLVSSYIYTEYHKALTEIPSSWEEIQENLKYQIHLPLGLPPFTGALLMPGSSPAYSKSMLHRRDRILANGFAVMIVDSFSNHRCLRECFGSPTPCAAYKDTSNEIEAFLFTMLRLCPAIETHSDQHLAMADELMDKASSGVAFLPAERSQDVFTALEIMRQHPAIDGSRLTAVGYSHGATAILETMTLVEQNMPPPGLNTLPNNTLDGLNSVVVYYPNCQPGMHNNWHSSVPPISTRFILAEQDEYVTPYFCYSVIQTINDRLGWKFLEVLSFDNRHAFDMPEYPAAYDPIQAENAASAMLEFMLLTRDTCPAPGKPDASTWSWLELFLSLIL